MEESRPRLSNQLRQSNGGLELALAALVLGLFGWWLDGRLGTSPWLLIVFSLFGFVGSSVSKYYRFKIGLESELEKTRRETQELQDVADE